jgi:hypothetical protein
MDTNLHESETPSEFAWRIGVPLKRVSRKLRHPDCPGNFRTVEGPSGRVVRLEASPELEAFIKTDPRKGKPSVKSVSSVVLPE